MEILVTLAIARRPFFTLEKAQDGHVILKYCKAQESFPHGSHIRPDEYLCSSRDIAVVLVLDMESKNNICRKNYSLFGSIYYFIHNMKSYRFC